MAHAFRSLFFLNKTLVQNIEIFFARKSLSNLQMILGFRHALPGFQPRNVGSHCTSKNKLMYLLGKCVYWSCSN